MPVASMGQYIGAKVTPSFFENPLDGTNDWVSGITYEELTVVTYGSKLYISKKPVRDITVTPKNAEYWLEYPSGGGGGGTDTKIPLTVELVNNWNEANLLYDAFLTQNNRNHSIYDFHLNFTVSNAVFTTENTDIMRFFFNTDEYDFNHERWGTNALCTICGLGSGSTFTGYPFKFIKSSWDGGVRKAIAINAPYTISAGVSYTCNIVLLGVLKNAGY